MAQLPALTQLYFKIADSLSEDDVKSLRAMLVPEILGAARVQHATPLEILKMLQADNKIHKGNLGLLMEILRFFGKGRLAEEAEQLEQEHRTDGAAAAAAMPQTAPMSEAHRTLLLRNYPTIYQELDATAVLDYLLQGGVLTDWMLEDILAIPHFQTHHRTRMLLDLILQMNDNAFTMFCSALGHAGYPHLMELLTGAQQQQLLPPMPMALALYPGFQDSEEWPRGEQPYSTIQNQNLLTIRNSNLLTTAYQNEQILQLKMKMRDEEFKALYTYQENQVKSLERARAFLSQESLERRFDELQAKVEDERAIIVRTYRGCVILFLTFESEPKFAHFWGSCTSGRLSDSLTELLMTEEMRSLEGGDQLVVRTLVLEQDYRAWRDFYRKGEPQQVEQLTSQLASLGRSTQTEELQVNQEPMTGSLQSTASSISEGSLRSLDSSGYGTAESQPEGRKTAAKYKASVEEAISRVTEEIETLDREIRATAENCAQVEKGIQQHYKQLISKLQLERQEMITMVQKVNRDKRGELTKEKEKLQTEMGKIKEAGSTLCEKNLDCKDNTEFLPLRQKMEEKFQKFSMQGKANKSLECPTKVTFQPSSLSQVSGGSLSVFAGFSIDVQEPAVESLPCSVTVTANTAGLTGGDVTPQIEVTSPQGKTTLIQTTAHSSPPLAAGKGQTSRVRRVWGGVWRPQTSGKHTLMVSMGVKRGLGSLTVDVGSNNPVLRFGQEGRQQGQFDRPLDVVVRGNRLYVADTFNKRILVFDLSGKFCHSFSTTTPIGLAVQTDGTLVVRSMNEVKKFSPSGELLHQFPLGEYCTTPYGLAVLRDGSVAVADRDGHSIFLFEADGTLVKRAGGRGQGEGQFYHPYFVCADKEDNIIVADKDNHRVQVFDKNLNFKHKFGQKGRQPQDMWGTMGVSADSRGNIVLASTGGNTCTGGTEFGKKLQVFRSDGTWVSTISSDGDQLNLPYGVAVTEDGYVFVTDIADHCIRKYRYM